MRIILLLALMPTVCAQSTWHVDLNATPPGDGSPGSPYASIQYAIDQAGTLPGDTLSIAPGTYVEALQFHGKALRLVGEQGRDLTIIEGGATIDGGMVITTELRGITLQQGSVEVYATDLDFVASRLASTYGILAYDDCRLLFQGSHFVGNVDTGAGGSPYWGSALWLVGGSVVIRDCLFERNVCGFGSALNLLGSIDCRDSVFLNNTSGDSDYGCGAIRGGGGTVENCEFRGNFALVGGAIAEGAFDVVRCTFDDNYAVAFGGAIYNHSGQVVDCTFRGNRSGRGGAMADSPGGVYRSLFIENVAECDFGIGGGIGGALTGVVAERCTFVANSAWWCPYDQGGGGAAHDSVLRHCVLVDNTTQDGAGSAADGCELESCIVLGDEEPRLIFSTAIYSLIEGDYPGMANFTGDPLFVAPDDGDFRLWVGSPCIDSGYGLDPDGTVADVGAYPFVPVSYCVGKPNSQGCIPAIGSTGSPRLTGPDDFYITASNVIPGEWGILALAGAQGFQPFFGGTLCLQAPIVRTTPTLAVGSGPCGGELSFHFSQAYMRTLLLLAYDEVYCQWWSRDPGLNPPVGLTDGLAVEVLP